MAYAEAEKAPATREANASDWREFARWCGQGEGAAGPHSGARGHRNARRTVNRFIVDGLPVRHSSFQDLPPGGSNPRGD